MEKLHARLVYSDRGGDWSYYGDLTTEEKKELLQELKRRGVIYHYGKGVYKWKNPVRLVYEWDEGGEYYIIKDDDIIELYWYQTLSKHDKDDDIIYSEGGEDGRPTLDELYTITLSTGRTLDFREEAEGGKKAFRFCKPYGGAFNRLMDFCFEGMLSYKEFFNRYYTGRREFGSYLDWI